MHGTEQLIRQVNRLYHQCAQSSFDAQHAYRHRIEQAFWEDVASSAALRARRTISEAGAGSHRPESHGLVVGEIGCGTGFVTTVLGSRLKSCDRLIAMDVSDEALKSTGQKWSARRFSAGPRLERVAVDAQTLPLATGSLDMMVVNAVLHHIPRPDAALSEIDRVLRPGGLFAMGFEPNRAHFESLRMRRLAKALDRAYWYASPRQNRRRLREWLGQPATPQSVQFAMINDAWAESINAQLMGDGLIGSPLSSRQILDLVDPHSREAAASKGFDPAALIRQCFPHYDVLLLEFTDYLGESVRRLPLVRTAMDRLLRAVVPGCGSLFSWLLRKPDDVSLTRPAGLRGNTIAAPVETA